MRSTNVREVSARVCAMLRDEVPLDRAPEGYALVRKTDLIAIQADAAGLSPTTYQTIKRIIAENSTATNKRNAHH